MLSPIPLFVISVTFWTFTATTQHSNHVYHTERRKREITGDDVTEKRTAKIISFSSFEGIRAAKILLQDAKQTFFGPSGRIYEKTGGYDQAKKDFEILKPRNVEEDPIHVDMRRGEVGDREVTLKKNGWLGNPTVYLIQNYDGPFRAGTIDTIIYP